MGKLAHGVGTNAMESIPPDTVPEDESCDKQASVDTECIPEETIVAQSLEEFASHFAEFESPDYQYSRPDTARGWNHKKKRRGKREEVPDKKKGELARSHVVWYNRLEAQEKDSSRAIFHRWIVEQSSSQVVYIFPDVVYVDKQEETRSAANGGTAGGKAPATESDGKGNDENKRIGHMNIRIEADQMYYNITSTDRQAAFLEMMAVLVKNNLLRRHIVVFMDGEQDLVDTMNALLGPWKPDIYLDWYHLDKKLYDLLSMAIIGKRIPDPRKEPELYKKGQKKGMIKKMEMTSLSRLYARELEAMLWVGNADEAIAYLENINPQHVRDRDVLQKLIKYLKNKKGWITCYAIRRRLGLRNSSNGVEGLNLTIIARRQKHNGMAWLGGSGILGALTCLFKNRQDKEWFRNRSYSLELVSRSNDDDDGAETGK